MSTEEQLEQARKIISKLLECMPPGRCADLHHGKKDRHAYDKPCPVEDRYNAIQAVAELFLLATHTKTPPK